MYLVLNQARPYWFERESEADLGQSSVSLFAGVENFQLARGTPSTACGGASQRIPTFAGHTPYVRVERFRVQFLQGVEYRPVMYPPSGRHQV
jgi:hypothetical protein